MHLVYILLSGDTNGTQGTTLQRKNYFLDTILSVRSSRMCFRYQDRRLFCGQGIRGEIGKRWVSTHVVKRKKIKESQRKVKAVLENTQARFTLCYLTDWNINQKLNVVFFKFRAVFDNSAKVVLMGWAVCQCAQCAHCGQCALHISSNPLFDV